MSQQTKPSRLSVTYYRAGHCVNQLAHVYRGHPQEKRTFPSGVFLIRHPKQGYALFDTGYSLDMYNQGAIGKLYCRLNPTIVKKSDEIASQLRKDGIKPSDIRYVILSHLHPDHIGGVKFFPKAKVIISKESYDSYKNPRTKDLIMKGLLPKTFEQQLHVIDSQDMSVTKDGLQGLDLFKDGSLLVVRLPGHTSGHLGGYAPGKLLLAGDASWGQDLMSRSHRMRFAARQVQHDYAQYNHTIEQIQKLQAKGVRVYFSHDICELKELL